MSDEGGGDVDVNDTVPEAEPGALMESPERAFRREAKAGMRVGTRVALALVVASVLPAALGVLALFGIEEHRVVAPPAPSPPSIEEVRAALAEVAQLEGETARARDDARAKLRAERQAALDADVVRLARDIAALKDARATKDAAEKAAPVTDDELAGPLSAIGVAAGGPRKLVRGKVEAAGPVACIAAEGLCVVEELPAPALASAKALSTTRLVLNKAAAHAPLKESGLPASPADIDGVRRRVVVGALVLAIVASAAVAWRIRSDLGAALAALEGRVRLVASGQPSERASRSRIGEIATLEDAVDALAGAALETREREEVARRRIERCYAMAERLDEIARGKVSARLDESDDVAEATLVASVNRVVDAFERRIVRLKSHVHALTRDGARAPDDERDPAAVIEKRIGGLRPIPPLLHDIAARLATLAKQAPEGARMGSDLAKLAEAVGQRARAAQALFDSLEGEVARLPRGASATSAGLPPAQQQALDALVADLEGLTVDSSLPRLVESLADLGPREVAARLAPERAST